MRARLLAIAAALAAAAPCPAARGDGGRVCASEASGALRVTVLTSPTPIRVGVAEVVVRVDDVNDSSPASAAAVALLLRAADGTTQEIDARPVAGASSSLYSVEVALASTGPLVIEARAGHGAVTSMVRCRTQVESALPPLRDHWPLVALPPVAVALFVTSRLLARRNATRRRQSAA
ncbi:MAG: hypothetical protein IT386_09175 [Deltaproteobacteria bacterium]|nr:hypothetical protein [Deltaproteobacteria bacterium]